MASGPYQSNLLRFFVGQYWQGLARHRQAVRKTRSTIVLGSELGLAVALAPVMAAAQASQKTFQKLRQSATKLRLSVGKSRTAENLLDFSGFDRLSTVSNRLNFQRLQPLLKRLPGEECSFDVSDIDVSASDINNAVALDSVVAEAVEAEAAIALTLQSVGACLLPQQINLLAGIPDRGLAPLVTSVVQRWRSVSRALLAPLGKQRVRPTTFSEPLATSSSEDLRSAEDLNGAETRKITGVASNLETRSLVLVLGHRHIWDGLTRSQQMDLQQSISCFINTGSVQDNDFSELGTISSGLLGRSNSEIRPASGLRVVKNAIALGQPDHPKSELVRPLISFWVAVLQVLDRFRPQEHWPALSPTTCKLPDELSDKCAEKSLVPGEKGSLIVQPFYFLIGVIFGAESLTDTPIGLRLQAEYSLADSAKLNSSDTPRLMPDGMVGSRPSICIDADVITVTYVEHPLEKLLKWVDRVLLWVESAWATLKSWFVQLMS